MHARIIIGDFLIILTAAFTVYLSMIMISRIRSVVLKDSYGKIFRYELLACAVFMLLSLDIRFGFLTELYPAAGNPALLKSLGWLLRLIAVFAAGVILFYIARVVAGGFIRTEAAARHAVAPGLALENGKPADDLVSRLDTAEQYLKKYPAAVLVLTGGNPDESGKTEAAVMRELLEKRGAAADRMILEDQAETTEENFRNTVRMIDPSEPIVLISSNYHMDRAVRAAKGAGFSDIRRLPAPSSFICYGANVLWEVILELNELRLRRGQKRMKPRSGLK